MELRDLRTFVAVASVLNFNRAGKALHAAQSTVSVRIQALEEELSACGSSIAWDGVSCSPRPASVCWSTAGNSWRWRRRLRAWVCGEASQGVLTVRMPESLCVQRLAGVIGGFREQFPKVRLRLIPCTFDGLTEDLRRGVTDLAFVLAYEIRIGICGQPSWGPRNWS